LLQSLGIEIKVVSTSWYSLNAANWAYFISKVFDVANLTSFVPLASILTLDDPGAGIAANKGALMAAYLSGKNWSIHDGLFVDDSPSNINSANGTVDWLLVAPRTGLAVNQLEYIESRANQTFATGAPTSATSGAPTSATTGAPTSATTGAPTSAPSGAPTSATTGAPTSAGNATGAPTSAGNTTRNTTIAPTPAGNTTNSASSLSIFAALFGTLVVSLIH